MFIIDVLAILPDYDESEAFILHVLSKTCVRDDGKVRTVVYRTRRRVMGPPSRPSNKTLVPYTGGSGSKSSCIGVGDTSKTLDSEVGTE
jgi:hypothetical protein